MTRMVSAIDGDTERGETRSGRGIVQVAAPDFKAEALTQLGNSTHPGTADAKEMKAAFSGQQPGWNSCAHAACRSPLAMSKQTCAMRAAASGCAAPRALCPISIRRDGSARNSRNAAARFSPRLL